MTIEDLKSIFAKFGTVDKVDIINARGRPLGFGFVTFKNADNAESAGKALNGKELDGRKIGVVEYRSRKKDGSAGMARGDKEDFEQGSAMSVVIADDVENGFDIPEHEYMDWNYGSAHLSSDLHALSNESQECITGLIDSGCSNHLSPHHLPEHRDRSTPIRFSVADGKHMFSTGDRGGISGYANTQTAFHLSDVHHVPDAKQTLISVHQLLNSGHDVWFDRSDMSVNIGDLLSRKTIAKDFAQHGVFLMTIHAVKPESALLSKGVLLPPNVSWHKRMFHLNHDLLKATQSIVNGMNPPPQEPTQHCEACVLGKMHQYPHRTITEKDTCILGVISVDLVFPPKHIPSLRGATCFMGISVRSCGFKFGYALKRRSGVAEYLDYARKFLERQTGQKVMEWHLDPAGEHKSKILLEAGKSLGITITCTGTEEHQQNAEIEGWFRIAFDGIRSHIIDSKAPLNLWAEGLHTYCLVWNRTLHGNDTKTPYEQLFGRRPTVADFRVLFCLAYVRTMPKDRKAGKLSPRAIKGRFIGMGMYDGQPTKTRGYKILCEDNEPNSVIISSDVYFVENVFDISASIVDVPVTKWNDHHDEHGFDVFMDKGEKDKDELSTANIDSAPPNDTTASVPASTSHSDRRPPEADEGYNSTTGEPPTPSSASGEQTSTPDLSPSSSDFHSAPSTPFPNSSSPSFSSSPSSSSSSTPTQSPPSTLTPPQRATRSNATAPDWSRKLGEIFEGDARSALTGWDADWEKYWERKWDGCFDEGSALLTRDGPKRVSDAMKDVRWKAAMNKEISQMYEKCVFELTDLPSGKQPIHSIWVLKEKEHDITKATEFKARLVLDGRQQQFGRDYDRTYAPTPSMESTKMLAAIRTERNMLIYQIDFKGAFLNSKMDKEIYIYQPRGFEVRGMERKVIKVNRALYGSCQASFLWNSDLHQLLVGKCKMMQCPFDPCVYKNVTPRGLILAEFHTDDGKIYADQACAEDMAILLDIIETTYPITRKDNVEVFLGIRIDFNDTTTSLDQMAYLQTILDDFQETNEMKSVPWDMSDDQKFDPETEMTEADVKIIVS
jgi:hypothetical protein